MRIVTAAFVLAAAVASAGVAAAEQRLSDSQFITVSRCRGLSSGIDTTAIDAVIEAGKAGRTGAALQQAAAARKTAERAVRKATGEGAKAELARQRATACAGVN